MEIHEEKCGSESLGEVGFESGVRGSGLEADFDLNSSVSDSESGVSGGSDDRIGLIRLSEGDGAHEIVRRRLLAGLGSLGAHTTVVAVHKNSRSSELGKARELSFHVFSKAVEKRRGGGVGNVRFAWYGAASKEAVEAIVSHGFCNLGKFENNGLYGSGVYLSPLDSPLESVKSLKIGEDGLRHLLLCRVILGKSEIVHIGSDQSHPSSDEFDSGVDSVSNPKKYIVWSTHMNTHILPEYAISFKAPPSLKGFVRTPELLEKPSTPWMPFSALVPVLSEWLPKRVVDVLVKYHKEHKEKRMTRDEFNHRLRKIAGDKLLIAAVKAYSSKQNVKGIGTSKGDGNVQNGSVLL